MPGRFFTAQTSYRYGFNGKEKDLETTETSTYDYGFRIYNPGLGRFLSVDPLTKSYPYFTSYQFAGNKPITSIDIDGLEDWDYRKLKALETLVNKLTSSETFNNAKISALASSDAIKNATSFGLSEHFGKITIPGYVWFWGAFETDEIVIDLGSNHLDEMSNDNEKQNYLLSRLSSDISIALICFSSASSVGAGSNAALFIPGVGSVLGGGGKIIASLSTAIALTATGDIGWALAKLNSSGIQLNVDEKPIDGGVVSEAPLDKYENPGHHDPSNNPANDNKYIKDKSVLPENHEELYKSSVLSNNGKTRWAVEGKGNERVFHVFRGGENEGGKWHWAGSSKGETRDGVKRPVTDIPPEIKTINKE